MAKKKQAAFRNRRAISQGKKEAGGLVPDFINDALDLPQKALMKGMTGMFKKPSEVINDLYQQEYPNSNPNENKIARAMTDIAVDPLNLLGLLKFGSVGMKGERILSAGDKAKKGIIKGSSIYDNVGEVAEKLAFGSKNFGSEDLLTQQFQHQYDMKAQAPNYIEDPNQTLARNNIRVASAMADANSNGFTQGLDILGSLGMAVGSQVASGGGGLAEGKEGLQKIGQLFKSIFATGGTVGSLPAEVEGQELAELPNGQVAEFQGPSHEQGGINVNLPKGTDVYSNRLKHPSDNKAMAKRKAEREKKISKLEKLSKLNPNDRLIRKSLERTKKLFAQEDEQDLQLQEAMAAQMEPNAVPKLAGGIKGFGENTQYDEDGNAIGLEGALVTANKPSVFAESLLDTRTTMPSAPDFVQGLSIPGGNLKAPQTTNPYKPHLPTMGDAMGIYGNLRQAFDPLQTTLENRAGDTPNINAYENFGKDGLAALEKAKGVVGQTEDAALFDLQGERVSAGIRNRNGARGINTQRALDIATDNQLYKAANDVKLKSGQQLAALLSQQSQLENQQDQMVMQGRQNADLADRQDRDAFYMNLGRDQQAVGEGISRTGKNLNEIAQRGADINMVNMLSDYFDVDPMSGKMKMKQGVDVTRQSIPNPTSVVEGDKTDSSVYNNLVNPATGKAFTEKQWDKYQKEKNEYSPELQELDTTYKQYVDPNSTNGAAFSSKTQYDKFIKAGRDVSSLGKYEGLDKITGSGFGKNLKEADQPETKKLLVKYLNDNKFTNFNIDNKEHVSNLQKALGLKADGVLGEKVFKALKKKYK